MDQNTFQLWSVIGTWVASVGTVSAVIFSLWLAYNQGKVKLKVNAGHRLIITPGSKARPEYCAIKVVNVGNRPVNISGVGWQAGWFKNKKSFVQIFNNPEYDDVPKVLNEGQEANFMVPLRLNRNEKDWIVTFPKDLAGDKGKTSYIKRLKVVVNTSVGQVFRVRAESSLVDLLLKSYEVNNAKLLKEKNA